MAKINNIENVVFTSTAQGFAAMRNKNSALPLDLKTILTLVDGVCPVAQYIPFLQLFAPLEPKFLRLEENGFVTRLGTVSMIAVRNFQASLLEGTSPDQLPRIDADFKDSNFLSALD